MCDNVDIADLCPDSVLTIPTSITVVQSSDFMCCANVSKIVFHDYVTAITDGSFYSVFSFNFPNLVEVDLGNGYMTIGNHVFRQQRLLSKVRFGPNVQSIGIVAFADCASNMTFENDDCPDISVDNGFLIWKPTKTIIAIPGRDRDELVIPDWVTTIGTAAGHSCLTCPTYDKVVLHPGITEIGLQAFCYCIVKAFVGELSASINVFAGQQAVVSNGILRYVSPTVDLPTMELPNYVTTIGYAAFRGCDKITTLVCPRKVSEVEQMAFHTTTIKSVIFSGPVTLDSNALSNSQVEHIVLKSRIITAQLPMIAPKLTGVTIPCYVDVSNFMIKAGIEITYLPCPTPKFTSFFNQRIRVLLVILTPLLLS